jgi:hypothetical protein
MRILGLLTAVVLMAAACTPGNNTSRNGIIEGTGTVQYVELEGGFYGLVADDGTRYDPSGLPEAFQEDGLRVSFQVEPREGVLTTRMWGQVVSLIEIERL